MKDRLNSRLEFYRQHTRVVDYTRSSITLSTGSILIW